VRSFKIEKLVRDKIPAFLAAKGVLVNAKILEGDEFISKLKTKLIEEANEVLETKSAEELQEELADVLEVIHALSKASGISLDQIEQKRIEKKQLRGSFENKIFNTSIAVEENNPIINHYIKKYPEITPKQTFNCIFCQIAREQKCKLFASFDHCFVIKDQFPVSNGHLLIIPHEHTENWFTAREEVRIEMMKVLHLMKERLDLECSPHGYNIGANCGEVAGQTVMHLHLHLIPRYEGDMEDPKGGVRGVIPSKQKY